HQVGANFIPVFKIAAAARQYAKGYNEQGGKARHLPIITRPCNAFRIEASLDCSAEKGVLSPFVARCDEESSDSSLAMLGAPSPSSRRGNSRHNPRRRHRPNSVDFRGHEP